MSTLRDQGVLEIEGARLAYRMIGPRPAQGPTLVLLPDEPGETATWNEFPDRLAAVTGLGVFVGSRAGPRPSLEGLEREARHMLPKMLESIGFRRGLLVGHGAGAALATLYAGGVQDHRVRGLVLIAPRFVGEAGAPAWDLTEALAYIRVPILIVQDSREEGAARQVEVAREECYCPVEAALLPDAGRSPHREAMEGTLEAVAAFADRIMRLHAEAAAAA